jgi:FkbM family methyltransferase
MLNAFKKLIPASMRQILADARAPRIYARASFSQEGEDLLLMRLFEGTSAGVYVDVGAHHPFRFSNTCLLHQQGWRGINIDARPGSMRLFRRFRPGDVNLEIGISEHSSSLEFFVFAEPALNTFDEALAIDRQKEGWALTGRTTVACLTLAQVLDQHLSALGADAVDLLTVDAEGLDLQVLKSNDWRRFRPRAIVVEILGSDFDQMTHSPTATFLRTVGYSPSAKLHNSVVFLPSIQRPLSS